MAAVTAIVEGNLKFREGKKWKSRWCVIKKPSPVADHLQVLLYKDVREAAKPEGKCKSVFTLDSYFGLDASVPYDREPYVLAIICEKNIFLFAFEQREDMIQFEIKIRQSLGEEHHFLVKVVKAPSSSKITKDQLSLIIHDTRFCLTAQSPPKILLSWNISDLRRFGVRDGKFCFEGGASCGKGAGLFALQSDQIETIADIIHFAATGKMSNSHRKFKNRSSQIDLGSHLITDIPSLPSQSSSSHIHHIHHSAAKAPLHGALPATLNCCHDNQTGSAESEDWNWYKRHSVSVMDYRRISALREKPSSESRDQLAMGIYDIPPNHNQRLDVCFPPPGSGHGYDHPKSIRSHPEISTIMSSASDNHEYCNTLDPLMEDPHAHYKYLKCKDSLLDKEDKNSKKSSHLHLDNAEGQPRNNSMSRNETLQRLKTQEYNIQKEMRLLDEMLLNCSSHDDEALMSSSCTFDPDKSKNSNKSCKKIPQDLAYANYDEVPMRLKEPVKEMIPFRSPSHEVSKSFRVESNKDLEIISGNISPRKINQPHFPQSSTQKKSSKSHVHLNKSMPEETPLSPLFHAKLNSIPSGSKLNAPLPYVNLSRYDDESTSHVHLPGSADCLPVARGSSFSSLNTSRDNQTRGPVVWRQHSGSLSCLPTPVTASSLTNLNQYSDFSHNRHKSNQSRFQLKQEIEGQSYNANGGNSEVLIVNLKGKNESEEKYKTSASKLAQENGKRLLSNNARYHGPGQIEIMTNELIYENLPITREETPPPALPPRGPALLEKLKSAHASSNDLESKRYKHSSLSPSTPHRQNKSFSSFHDTSFGYDNNLSNINQRDLYANDNVSQENENYLRMGSPKTSQKFSATVPLALASKKKAGSKLHVRDDYMDMGVIGTDPNGLPDDVARDDEIYLDVDETIKFSPKNSPERRMSGKAMPLGLPPAGSGASRESTYVDMATVSTRKSMVIQNLETLQAYVSKKPGGEKGTSSSQTPTSPPPLPRSYKVRHNSDSGLPSKENGDMDVNSEKTKAKSPMKVYTKVKSTDAVNKSPSGPPLPFQNLMDFTKKMTDCRPTYVNTYIDAEKNLASFNSDLRSIPLPEPVKEGFLARLKRRSSKDKGSPAPEKTGSAKSRSNALERSMSEHDSPKSHNKEEKISRLKIGRRRSSSFPNRLSYQEAHDEDSHDLAAKKADSSSSSISSCSVKPKLPYNPGEHSESSSSFQDCSDESDVSPLLKRYGRKMKPHATTVLHVQQNHPFDKNLYMHTSRSTSCLVSQIPNSSKTDDEKLSEMLFKGQAHGRSFEDSSTHDISFEKNQDQRLGMPKIEPQTKLSQSLPCQDLKKIRDSSSEYCLMDPPNLEKTSPLSVSIESDKDSLPPALPPKNRNYHNLLSPVIEATPPSIPPRPYLGRRSHFNEEDMPEETVLDQYVELSHSYGSHDKPDGTMTTSLESKAGRPSDSLTTRETLIDERKYATITLPIAHASGLQIDRDSSCLQVLSSQSCIFHHGTSSCASPAKSVLRPRNGQEYVVIQRIATPPRLQSPCATSVSPTIRHVFNYDVDPEAACQGNTLSQLIREQHCHLDHSGSYDSPVNSKNSSPAHHVPQRSPSIVSNSETIRFNLGPCLDQRGVPKSIQNQNSRTRLTSLSVSTLSSPSPSPRSGISLHQMSPLFNSSDLSANLTQAELEARGNQTFFPDEISISTASDFTQCDQSYLTEEDFHVYVNQEYVFKHRQNSLKRTGNSFNSHSSVSPGMAGASPCLSLFRDSLQSKLATDAPITPQGTRQRLRNSESDAARAKPISHSFGHADRLQKSLTLPPTVHRSHSDPKQRSRKSPCHSPNHIHQKKFDKFAKSSIIARRRQQHAASKTEQPCHDSMNGLPPSPNVFTSSFGLQVPLIKSSGYKNIDTMKALPASGSSVGLLSDISPVDVFEQRLSPGFSDSSSYLSHNSSLVITSTPTTRSKPSHSPMPINPPPLPPRRVSTPSTISPALTPHTCGSDSPPPYRAPPPPLLQREATSPPMREDSFSSSSSGDEQELIYIEVDMTKRHDDVRRTPSVSLSRRTRRAKEQRDLARMRYVEIDHTATKALKETSEKLRDERRHMGESSIGRKNSSASTKHRESPIQVSQDRHLSTVSIE